MWSAAETNLLLQLYIEYLPLIGPLKKFKSKKEMWLHMATKFPGKTDRQCESRYKTVLKRKKSKKDSSQQTTTKTHNKTTTTEVAEDENDTIVVEEEHNNETEVQNQVNNALKKNKTIQETLLEIATRREEARERRHKEKLEAINRMLKLLQEIVKHKNKE